MNSGKFNLILLVILLVSLFTSCAAAGNMISHTGWVGALDLAAAAGITFFILAGKNK
jgi:hypothetical protein